MSKFENRTMYHDSTDSSSEEGSINPKKPGIMDSPVSTITLGSEKSAAKHSDLEETIEEEKSSGKIIKPEMLLKGNCFIDSIFNVK